MNPSGPKDFGVGGYTLAQVPNPPILIAVAASILSRIFTKGSTAYFIARAVFFAGFMIWAYLELAEGVNLFRRLLGAGALAISIYWLQDDLAN